MLLARCGRKLTLRVRIWRPSVCAAAQAHVSGLEIQFAPVRWRPHLRRACSNASCESQAAKRL